MPAFSEQPVSGSARRRRSQEWRLLSAFSLGPQRRHISFRLSPLPLTAHTVAAALLRAATPTFPLLQPRPILPPPSARAPPPTAPPLAAPISCCSATPTTASSGGVGDASEDGDGARRRRRAGGGAAVAAGRDVFGGSVVEDDHDVVEVDPGGRRQPR